MDSVVFSSGFYYLEHVLSFQKDYYCTDTTDTTGTTNYRYYSYYTYYRHYRYYRYY